MARPRASCKPGLRAPQGGVVVPVETLCVLLLRGVTVVFPAPSNRRIVAAGGAESIVALTSTLLLP